MKFYQFVLAGLLGALVLAGVGFLLSRGQAARLEGTITNVRTLGMDEKSSVAIVDFEARNPSEILMVIEDREISVVDSNGIPREGATISASDLKGLFQYFPALGPIENEAVIDGMRIPAGGALRGMVAARFEIPKHLLDRRQEITLRVRDVDGGISHLTLKSEAESDSP